MSGCCPLGSMNERARLRPPTGITTVKPNHYDGLRKICRCPRRSRAKCRHPWHFSFLHKGIHHRFSLDKHLGRRVESYGDARAEADTLRSAIRDGTFRGIHVDVEPARGPVLTFGEFADLWLTRESVKLAAHKKHAYRITRFKSFPLPGTQPPRTLGQTPLTDVRTDDIEVYRDARRAAGLSPVTVNHDLKLLRRMFSWGIRKGYLERTPFKIGTEPTMRLEREIPRNRRFENDDDEQRLLAAANPHLRAVIIAMLDTACRPGEIFNLQVRDVSIARRELTIRAVTEKTRTERIVPISKRLLAVLELRLLDPAGRPLPPEAYAFGDPLGRRVKSVRTAWNNTCEAIGLEGFQLRDLRHEAGSRFDEAGIPINYVSKVLGHTDLTTTTRYLNVQRRELHRVMRQYEERFASRLQDQPPNIETNESESDPSKKKNPSVS